MGTRYVVWRKAIDPMVGEDPLVWEGSVFFQLWSRRPRRHIPCGRGRDP